MIHLKSLIRAAVALTLVFRFVTPAVAEEPSVDAIKAEMAEYKAFFEGAGDSETAASIDGIAQMLDANELAGSAMWTQMKVKLDAKKKTLASVKAPATGKISFSKREGGAGATRFTLGSDAIFGRLVLSAPLKAFNQAYAIPPGSEDYDHGDVMVRVTLDDKPFWQGRAVIWDREYDTKLELPFAVLPGDAEVPVYTKSANGSRHLWEDEDTHKLFAESLLGVVYDALAAGTHSVKVQIFAREGFDRRPPAAEGSFELVVTKAGQRQLATMSKRKAPHKAGGKYAKVDAKITKLMQHSGGLSEQGFTILFARTQTAWNETRDALTGRVTKRHIKADVAYRTKDGQCRVVQGVEFCQASTRQGGGEPFDALAQCSTLGMDQLGQNTYAIPCAKVE